MKEFQFPDKLIRLVKAAMENSQCQVMIQADLSDPPVSGLRQGNYLACVLFNIEKVVRDTGFQTRGTIFYKSVQLLAYADDIDIIGRLEHNIKITFKASKTAADAMGVSVK
jgi:sorting nexin-29